MKQGADCQKLYSGAVGYASSVLRRVPEPGTVVSRRRNDGAACDAGTQSGGGCGAPGGALPVGGGRRRAGGGRDEGDPTVRAAAGRATGAGPLVHQSVVWQYHL